MVIGDKAEHGGNPRPSTGCCQSFLRTAQPYECGKHQTSPVTNLINRYAYGGGWFQTPQWTRNLAAYRLLSKQLFAYSGQQWLVNDIPEVLIRDPETTYPQEDASDYDQTMTGDFPLSTNRFI